MNKEAFYFPHDYEPTGDPKIQALIGEYGAQGYGIFWRIIEMLHSDCEHKLPLKQYIILAIAKQMLTDAKQIQAIIDYCITPCELFISDTQYFWSNRVNSNFEKRAQISEVRSIAGKAGAIAKQKLANTSKGKERKRKESKVKELIAPSLLEVETYFEENGYKKEIGKKAWMGYDVANWINSQGKPVLNWKQTMINVWFKEEHKINGSKIKITQTTLKANQR